VEAGTGGGTRGGSCLTKAGALRSFPEAHGGPWFWGISG